jgi:aminopeptidase
LYYGNLKRDTNYPVGEVYTAPLEGSAKGTVYVKSSKVIGETILHNYPKKYFFENGILKKTNFKKLNKAMKELEKFNSKQGIKKADLKVRNFAEFAIGTNKKASLVGVMICDEKTFGTCHVGIGSNSHFGGKIKCSGHSDHVIEKPNIWFDKKQIMKNGKLMI